MKYFKTPLAMAILAASLSTTANANELEDRIAALEAQIAELKAMVAEDKQHATRHNGKASQGQSSTKTVASAPATKDSKKSGTDFNYGGYIQLDLITTRYNEGKPASSAMEDFLIPSLIPVESTTGSNDAYTSTNMHTKTSRIFFTTNTPTDVGDIATRVEMDFALSASGDERISNSFNPRLRHAFVNWKYAPGKSLLAGQTWSTFFNVGALPGVQDFVGPVGTLFNRQPQIRWTTGAWQFALENPATRLNYDGGSRLDDAEIMPDIVARYNGKSGNLSWSVAGVVRELSYESRASSAVELASESTMGYGLSVAGKLMTQGKDNFKYMFNYGNALGRYLGLNSFNDGYVAADGDIETIDQWGATLAYEHYWSAMWRSHFSISASGADNPSAYHYAGASSLAKGYQSVHANIQWLPAPKLMVGGELAFAKKELEDGRTGDLSRLQFSIKYAF